MRHTLQYVLTALLVLALAACDDSTNPGGFNPNPDLDIDEQPIETTYTLTTAFGPLDEHHPPIFTVHALLIEAHMIVDPPLEHDADFHFSIYRDGELVDDTFVLDMLEGQYGVGTGAYVEGGFYPGLYTIVVTLEGEEVARDMHDLRDYTGGMPAPDVTVTIDDQHVTIDLDDFSADWGHLTLNKSMGSGTFEMDYYYEYRGEKTIQLEYDPTIIDPSFDYYVILWAREQPYDFTKSVTTRYVHAFLPVELEFVTDD